jgi:N-acylglucosamine-6-phosphate 2-epimerase
LPVVLEGRIWEPEQVNKAFELGAHCVVIGSAITRPQLITRRFVFRGK